MKISEQIQNLTATQKTNLKIADSDETYYSGDVVCDLMLSLYSDYTCHNFYDNFRHWLTRNNDNFIRVLLALRKEYDITENYDRTTDTYTDNAEATTTTDITSPTVTNETKSASYDSENYKAQSQNIATVTGENKTETTIEFDKTNSDGHNTVFHDRTHGNIGVTTVAQMINQEYEMRSHDYLIEYLNRFVNTFAFYVWSDND